MTAEGARVPLLLLANGVVLATHTMLARQAGAAGVSPIVYALAGAVGAAIVLALLRRLAGSGRRLDRTVAAYGLVAGFVSIALPQSLIYSASAYVSAGIASLAYAFPTPLTFVLAALLGVERATLGRSVGIAIAFAGALILALSRSTSLSGEGFWIALAMAAPVAIAAGNIYRSRFWPEGAAPLDLALAMSAGAGLWLGLATVWLVLARTGGDVTGFGPAALAFLAVGAGLASIGNLVYFELQRSGGIVSFSQIGYVGAVIGLLGGTALLGERYGAATWLAALVIALGIVVAEVMKRRETAA